MLENWFRSQSLPTPHPNAPQCKYLEPKDIHYGANNGPVDAGPGEGETVPFVYKLP
jgi:hypothetical protein